MKLIFLSFIFTLLNATKVQIELLAKGSVQFNALLLQTVAELEDQNGVFEALQTLSGLDSSSTDQQVYSHISKNIKDKALFDLYLTSKYSFPLVLAQYDYYNSTVASHHEEASIAHGSTEQAENSGICQEFIYFDKKIFCDFGKFRIYFEKVDLSKVGEIDDGVKQLGTAIYRGNGKILTSIWFSSPSKLFNTFIEQFNEVSFVFMWIPVGDFMGSHTQISGYGIEMAVKSTEYKATDDQILSNQDVNNNSNDLQTFQIIDYESLRSIYPNASDNQIEEFKQHVEQTFQKRKLFTGWKKDSSSQEHIGYSFASYVLSQPFPFHVASLTSSMFPSMVDFLLDYKVDPDIKSEIISNQKILQQYSMGGQQSIKSLALINGLTVDFDNIDFFSVLETMKIELKYARIISEFKLKQQSVSKFIASTQKFSSQKDVDGNYFDLREKFEQYGRSQKPHDIPSVLWWNDIEKDSKYKKLPTGLEGIFQVQSAGQIPLVRKNIVNVIVTAPITSRPAIKILNQLLSLVFKDIPIRLGYLPSVTGQDSDVQGALALFVLFEFYGKKAALEFIEAIQTIDEISRSGLSQSYSQIIKKHSILKKTQMLHDFVEVPFDQLSKTNNTRIKEYEAKISKKTRDFFLFNQYGTLYDGEVFVNGAQLKVDDRVMSQFMNTVAQQINLLQQLIYFRRIGPNTNIYDALLKQNNAKTRRNPYLVTGSMEILDLNELGFDLKSLQEIKYYGNCNKNCYITVWISAESSIESIKEVLKFVNEDKVSRVAILGEIDEEKTLHILSSLDSSEFEEKIKIYMSNIKDQRFPKNFIQILKDSVVVNSKKIGPFHDNYHLMADDYQQLKEKDYKILKYFSSQVKDEDSSSDQALLIHNSLLNLNLKHVRAGSIVPATSTIDDIQRSDLYEKLKYKYSGSNLGSERQLVQVVIIVDPVTEIAQKIFNFLEKLLLLKDEIQFKMILAPNSIKSEKLPISRYYSLFQNSKPHFDNTGQFKSSQFQLNQLPEEPLLTLAVDVPQSWIVMQKQSIYDLDNIRLIEVKNTNGLFAQFELSHILIEGHATDDVSSQAPRGLQFDLSKFGNHYTGTIVMANLGYYQLQAYSGVWTLQVREGRSRDFYNLNSLQINGIKTYSQDYTSLNIYLTKFTGVTAITTVSKKQEKLYDDILAQDSSSDNQDSVWKSWFTLNRKSEAQNHADINIFSVASGHLYERFLRIMILSVLKNTKHTVKFWFIENFLSPQFKDFIPIMAQKYNFKYQLVTYKWPQWLRHQTEKQRIIWAYKILFLDVLFPLDLDKIIFVDADQIVRTDLKELVDLDLKKAPYGYTPFCDNRPEIDSFRFWKTGYWKDHLSGKPYHISALYVVDLNRFRMIAAGDKLRQHYQMVTNDPNSLANLDQDLPNDVQDYIPIFSLPQEWLWCETWCSDESLSKAKTIDLCNNPMTKEPKLDRARRLLPEWNVYDTEQRQLFDQWKQERKSGNQSSSPLNSPSQPTATTVQRPDEVKDEL